MMKISILFFMIYLSIFDLVLVILKVDNWLIGGLNIIFLIFAVIFIESNEVKEGSYIQSSREDNNKDSADNRGIDD